MSTITDSFFLIIPRPPRPPLFPYTTLFRSVAPSGMALSASAAGRILRLRIMPPTWTLEKGLGLPRPRPQSNFGRSEEHTSELQSLRHLVCRLLLETNKTRATQP